MKNRESHLNEADLRITRQRQLILDEFKRNNTHLTADDVYERVKRKLPRVSLGTIYRNLEILSECGLIRKVELAGNQKKFDGNTGKHYHIRCIKCDRLEDIPADSIKIEMPEPLQNIGYEIVRYRLEIMGICPRCKAESAAG